jgi:hypothetical protein
MLPFPFTPLMTLTRTLLRLGQKRHRLPDTEPPTVAQAGVRVARAAERPRQMATSAPGQIPPPRTRPATQDRHQGHHPQDRPANQERDRPGRRGPQERPAQDQSEAP